MRIKVIGAGGIGTALLYPLSRYLNFLEDEKASVTVIDGDIYEHRNSERQVFSRIGSKASVTVENLKSLFTQVEFEAMDEYVTDESVDYMIDEEDIVFLCVDNHKTRYLVSLYCEQLSNVTLISGGNDYTDGNVQVYIRRNGEDVTLPIANDYHQEILYPEDRRPDEIGCDEQVEAEPQLIFANNTIAAIMHNVFYAVTVYGKVDFDEVYADIISSSCRPVKR